MPESDTTTSSLSRIAIAFAGLFGALATAGAAAAAHGFGGDLLGLAAAIAFVHAPTLLALGLAGPGRLRAPFVPAGLMILGVLLFSGDLASRAFVADRLFINAAPSGGLVLIAGWVSLVVLACLPPRKP